MSQAKTGYMRFGDDWRGVFLRGDDAMRVASDIRNAVEMLKASGHADSMVVELLKRSMNFLFDVSERDNPAADTQAMKPYPECVP